MRWPTQWATTYLKSDGDVVEPRGDGARQEPRPENPHAVQARMG